MNECQLKPHILLFSDSSIKNVIPYFSQLVQQYKGSGELNCLQDKPLEIKVISWNTNWKDDEDSRSNLTKLRLEDYALLKVLRIENISTNENRLYTISNLINHLKVNSELNYSDLNLKVY